MYHISLFTVKALTDGSSWKWVDIFMRANVWINLFLVCFSSLHDESSSSSLDLEILPLFFLSLGKLNFKVHFGFGFSQNVEADSSEWIKSQVDEFKAIVFHIEQVEIYFKNFVRVSNQFAQVFQLENDVGQCEKWVARYVECLQLLQVDQLVGKFRHLIVRQIQFCKKRKCRWVFKVIYESILTFLPVIELNFMANLGVILLMTFPDKSQLFSSVWRIKW